MQRLAKEGIFARKPLRPSQIIGIDAIQENWRTKRFFCINAPTGVGKSLLAFESIEKPFFYLCSSKYLQLQISRDFPETAILFGKQNYSCQRKIFSNADECVLKEKCKDCQYLIAKTQVLNSKVSVLNFNYFLSAANYTDFIKSDTFYKRNIIIDEADMIEFYLSNFISLTLSFETLSKFEINFLPKSNKFPTILEFLERVKNKLIDLKRELEPKVFPIEKYILKNFSISSKDKYLLNHFHKLEKLLSKVEIILQEINENEWVSYLDNNQIHFKPIWLTKNLVNKFLFQHGKKFLLMSATLPPDFILQELLKIPEEEMLYLELPSMFPAKNRPIYLDIKYKLSHKLKIPEKLIQNEVKKFLSKNRKKGLIHTVSFKLSKVLFGISDRLIIHNETDKIAKLQEFFNSTNGVFVSPSSTRGLDLKGDLVRWIIFLKCPYLELEDLLVKERLFNWGKWGRTWYIYSAAQDLIQGFGRGVRDIEDWAEGFAWDEEIAKILILHSKVFPNWFRESVVFL